MSEPYSMRRAAYQAVRGWADRGWRIDTSVRRIRQSQGLETRDVATATDIAATVIKRLASLDVVLKAYCSRKRDKVENELWTLAQVGAAQVLFRPDIPAHAAVHETVAVADEIGKPQWKGFLNGLLRGVVRGMERQHEINFTEGLRAVAAQSRDAHNAWCVFDKPLVDGGPTDAEWLSRVYSLPRWLTRRWLETDWADTGGLETFLRACNQQASQWLRVNRAYQSRDELIASLREAFRDNVTVTPGPLDESIEVAGSLVLSQIADFEQGACSVQDLTAMRAVDRLDPQPGETILDLCSAPGGKACHIAERMKETGRVVACDVSESRLAKVQDNVDRIHLPNVEVTLIGKDGLGVPPGPYDAVLVDVPCSNTGVLAKRPEARWRIKEADLEELPEVQEDLLHRASTLTKPGGRVVYSTCSVEPEENHEIVEAFVAGHPNWTLAAEELFLPSGPGDGGYHALLQNKPQ